MADDDVAHTPLTSAFTALLPSGVTPDTLLPPHRALNCPPATNRAVWDSEHGTADRVTLRDQIARATADLGTPWPLPLASTAALYHRTGDRDTHETLVFTRQYRLSRAAIAAAATLDPRFLDEVADGTWQLCEQSSWCWPAHDDAFATTGSILPDVTRPFLDLGAGEVISQLAWIDQLLGTQLDEAYPGLRARIRHEARVRIFDPFMTRRDWKWLGLAGEVNNWNPWIHGNVLVAALRLLDGPGEAQLRADVVARVISGIDIYVAELPHDGAIDEGFHYWWNGACRALEAFEILYYATDGRLDALGAVPSLRATVGFPHRMHLGGEWVLNLSDGTATISDEVAWDALHRSALHIGDDDAAAFAASRRKPGLPVAREDAGFGRLVRALVDRTWTEAVPAASPLPRDVWLDSIQVRLIREQAGSYRGLTLAIKGGHNAENHNHNDIGEIVVASDGVPVLVDAGRPTYTAQTFSDRRYELWMMQSAWHNVPLVRGHTQRVGAEYRAHATQALDNGLSLDIAPAYGLPELSHWTRTARVDGSAVVLHDAWTLEPWREAGLEPPTCLHFLAAGEVVLVDGGADIIPLDGAPAVHVAWPGGIRGTLTQKKLDDPTLSNVWGKNLTRVELDVTGRTNCEIRVTQKVTA